MAKPEGALLSIHLGCAYLAAEESEDEIPYGARKRAPICGSFVRCAARVVSSMRTELHYSLRGAIWKFNSLSAPCPDESNVA